MMDITIRKNSKGFDINTFDVFGKETITITKNKPLVSALKDLEVYILKRMDEKEEDCE